MPKGPSTCAIVLAGGSGSRAGRRKQFQRAAGRSLLYHACLPFAECREVGGIVVVAPRGKGIAVTEELDDAGLEKLVAVVRGGESRHESSAAGLAGLPPSCEWVLIHDAARPFIVPSLIRRVLRQAKAVGAAVPALAVRDSVVELAEGGGKSGRVARYVDRGRLRAVQTPQAFSRKLLEDCFARFKGGEPTDDAQVVLAAGQEVALVEGDPENWKITDATDLRRAIARVEVAAQLG